MCVVVEKQEVARTSHCPQSIMVWAKRGSALLHAHTERPTTRIHFHTDLPFLYKQIGPACPDTAEHPHQPGRQVPAAANSPTP